MNFLSAKELAEKWNVKKSFVLRLVREGRIDGAMQIGKQWMFPLDAQKPLDGRTKIAKSNKENGTFFRFPLYVNFSEDRYSPPLSSEENSLQKAQIAFQACRFDEAKALLVSLFKKAENRYVKLSAMYHLLYIEMFECNPRFEPLYLSFTQELAEEFPYQNEMRLMHFGFDADNTAYKSILDDFHIKTEYTYHPSAFYVAALVAFIPVQNGDFALMSRLRYDTQELLCQQMERDGHFLEAQKMHYLLAVCYQLQNNTAKTEAHIRRGLTLAQEHKLYFAAAFYERWYRNETRRILRDFPTDFSEKIKSLGAFIEEKLNKFSEMRGNKSYISELSGKEFEYAFLANQGYTNREIASKHKVSEKTVSRIYREIYDKLGVKDKQELVDLINGSHRSNM